MDLVASHQRLLLGAALRTQGPLLELGVGWYSTPLLHEIAVTQGRPLLTVDNNQDWLAQFLCLQNDWHTLDLVGWWGELYELPRFRKIERWGLVFVDQGQPIEREYAVRGLLDQADVFVLHDTEEAFAYGYSRTLPMFKWKFEDRTHKVHTTVASNTIDVMKWFTPLPVVEPTVEVT